LPDTKNAGQAMRTCPALATSSLSGQSGRFGDLFVDRQADEIVEGGQGSL
jgi:hypothetical protein